MMIQPIPRHFLNQLNRHDHQVKPLEAYLTNAISDGRFKPGDAVASPDELADKYRLSPYEVLETINQLLAKGVLRQDRTGQLFVGNSSTRPPHSSGGQQVA